VLRDRVSRVLPVALKRWLRPRLVPVLQRLERPRLERLYRPFVPSGELVFDVGAAEGSHACVFRRLGARVVAVEPQPYCLGVLRRRFAADPGVTVVAAGAAEAAGELPFFVSEGDPELSTFALEKWRAGRFAKHSWERSLSVPVVTLDALISEHGLPVFIKVDVEGLEPRVLEGLSRPPRALCFEFTAELLEDAAVCLRHLATLEAIRCNASLYRRHRLVEPTFVAPAELLERLAGRSDPHLQGDLFVSFS
jgi:FkbM family methyltransferase